ncbi:MAG: transcriptional regulator [Pirellulales bacterium]
MSKLDPLIHQETRLRLMAVLVDADDGDWVSFVALKDELKLTDGNLGAQIQKLEDAGYVKVKKTFVARRPRTLLQATSRGRAAFVAHREALKEILGDA